MCLILFKQHLSFNLFEPGIFDPIVHSIRRYDDPWMVAADFRSYIDMQHQVITDYSHGDKTEWIQKSIRNTAASGYFSSDRTISDYAKDIWKLV